MSSAQDSGNLGQHQSIRGTAEFFAFLETDSGLHAIASVESDYDTEIRVENDEIFVHPSQLLPDVERELKNHWHEYEFNRTMRLKLLSERAQSWILHFPRHKAATVLYNRAKIIRDARLVELVVERSGEIVAFGCVDALSTAREIIDGLDYSASPYPPPNPYAAVQYRDGPPIEGSESAMNLLPDYPVAAPSFPEVDRYQSGVDASSSNQSLAGGRGGVGQKKEKLLFMVKSTDAPRLIGSRGINKRKIEDVTQCHITLHTETKKGGEFPVEVVGWTMEKCVAAREHIKAFLSEENKQEEEKKSRERPKIHLDFSPSRKPMVLRE